MHVIWMHMSPGCMWSGCMCHLDACDLDACDLDACVTWMHVTWMHVSPGCMCHLDACVTWMHVIWMHVSPGCMWPGCMCHLDACDLDACVTRLSMTTCRTQSAYQKTFTKKTRNSMKRELEILQSVVSSGTWTASLTLS